MTNLQVNVRGTYHHLLQAPPPPDHHSVGRLGVSHVTFRRQMSDYFYPRMLHASDYLPCVGGPHDHVTSGVRGSESENESIYPSFLLPIHRHASTDVCAPSPSDSDAPPQDHSYNTNEELFNIIMTLFYLKKWMG